MVSLFHKNKGRPVNFGHLVKILILMVYAGKHWSHPPHSPPLISDTSVSQVCTSYVISAEHHVPGWSWLNHSSSYHPGSDDVGSYSVYLSNTNLITHECYARSTCEGRRGRN